MVDHVQDPGPLSVHDPALDQEVCSIEEQNAIFSKKLVLLIFLSLYIDFVFNFCFNSLNKT